MNGENKDLINMERGLMLTSAKLQAIKILTMILPEEKDYIFLEETITQMRKWESGDYTL
jgi:hypothetical protein